MFHKEQPMPYMSNAAALKALRLARESRDGSRPLPPEIAELKAKINEAIRKAELFVAIFRVVDEGMVNSVVRLKLELDRLYAIFADNETSETIH